MKVTGFWALAAPALAAAAFAATISLRGTERSVGATPPRAAAALPPAGEGDALRAPLNAARSAAARAEGALRVDVTTEEAHVQAAFELVLHAEGDSRSQERRSVAAGVRLDWGALAVGDYFLTAAADGWIVEPQQLRVIDGATLAVTLAARRAVSLVVEVLGPDGTPARDAAVALASLASEPPRRLFDAQRDPETGYYTSVLALAEAARLELLVRTPEFPARLVRLESVPVDVVRVHLEEGQHMRGRVTDRGGAPIAAARIECRPRSDALSRWVGDDPVDTRRARTSALGSFEFFGLPRAEVVLRAWAPDYAAQERTVDAGERLDAIEIRLVELADLTGVVLRPDGALAEGAEVAWSGAELDESVSLTDEHGTFRFERAAASGGAAGRLLARSGSQRSAPLDLPTGGEVLLQLLETGSLSGSVLPAPAAGIDVLVRSFEFDATQSRHFEGGDYLVDALLPGSYAVTVGVGSSDRDLGTVVVHAGAVSRLEPLLLKRGVALEGRVVSSRGAALAGVRCLLHVDEEGAGASRVPHETWTDALGRFRFPDLPQGVARFDVRAQGAAPYGSDWIVLDGFSDLDLGDIVLEESAGLRVRLLDEQRRPRPGVTVLLTEPSGYMRTGTTEADGEAAFSDVPPGEARVTVSAGMNEGIRGVRVALRPGEERVVDLEALAESAWTTRLLRNGTPLSGVAACVSSAGGVWRTATETVGPDGSVTFEGVQSEPVVLTYVLAPGTQPLRLELPRFGEGPRPAELELAEAGG